MLQKPGVIGEESDAGAETAKTPESDDAVNEKKATPIVGENKLFQDKTQTFYLEQNNGRQRHSYARFRKKSILVSKTLEMVDLTMALFARSHVNGTGKGIAPLIN